MSCYRTEPGFTLMEVLIAALFIGLIILEVQNITDLVIAGNHHILHAGISIRRASDIQTALNRDFMQIQVDEKHPLIPREAEGKNGCLSSLSFFVRTPVDPDFHSAARYNHVTWSMTATGLLRTLRNSDAHVLYQTPFTFDADCFELSDFRNQRWQKEAFGLASRPVGVAWRLIFKQSVVLERRIPLSLAEYEGGTS